MHRERGLEYTLEVGLSEISTSLRENSGLSPDTALPEK